MFNHSSTPNVNFIRNFKDSSITFQTIKKIKAGEELFICYLADESKLWFKPSGKVDTVGSTGTTNGHSSRSISGNDKEDKIEREWDSGDRELGDDEDKDGEVNGALGMLPELGNDDLMDQETRLKEELRKQRLAGVVERHSGVLEGREKRKDKYINKSLKPKVEPSQIPSYSNTVGPLSIAPNGNGKNTSPPAIISPIPRPFSAAPTPIIPIIPIGDLPAPLHSDETARSSPNDLVPAVITDDLDWRGLLDAGEEDWGVLERVRGPGEVEEDVDYDTLSEWRFQHYHPPLPSPLP